ncbi:MAG: hypothetical protein HKN73_05080 [Gemmatimonadetes bacterium]|nr:hypothetical protein [Gemmatimonadota bacterium]
MCWRGSTGARCTCREGSGGIWTRSPNGRNE